MRDRGFRYPKSFKKPFQFHFHFHFLFLRIGSYSFLGSSSYNRLVRLRCRHGFYISIFCLLVAVGGNGGLQRRIEWFIILVHKTRVNSESLPFTLSPPREWFTIGISSHLPLRKTDLRVCSYAR